MYPRHTLVAMFALLAWVLQVADLQFFQQGKAGNHSEAPRAIGLEHLPGGAVRTDERP